MYKLSIKILRTFLRQDQIFKFGFNISPMYRRSTGRIKEVSVDIYKVKVKIPLSYKNRNYVGAIFGGSMFAATDPIYMIQLMQILGDKYVVWDKAATINYLRPAKENIQAIFEFTDEEIVAIKNRVVAENEINVVKRLELTNATGTIFARLEKTIYIASKDFYKKKLKARGRK